MYSLLFWSFTTLKDSFPPKIIPICYSSLSLTCCKCMDISTNKTLASWRNNNEQAAAQIKDQALLFYFLLYFAVTLFISICYTIFFQKQETFKTWHASERPADKKMIMHATIYKGYCRARGRSHLRDRT